MHETGTAQPLPAAGQEPPRAVRFAMRVLAAVLLVGALYLIAVRGDVLLTDLKQLSLAVFCM